MKFFQDYICKFVPYEYIPRSNLRSVAVYVFVVLAIACLERKNWRSFQWLTLSSFSSSVTPFRMHVGSDTSLVAACWLQVLYLLWIYFEVFFVSKQVIYFSDPGKPVMLVHKGQIIQEHLDREKNFDGRLELLSANMVLRVLTKLISQYWKQMATSAFFPHNYSKRSVRRRKAHKVLSKTSWNKYFRKKIPVNNYSCC